MVRKPRSKIKYEPTRPSQISPQAVKKANTDITKMNTFEVIARLYHRHSTGFWMTYSILATGTLILTIII